MTDQVIVPVESAVNNALRMMQNQLTNTLSMLDTQAVAISESLKADGDQYNSLVDEIELRGNLITTLKLKIKELEINADKFGDVTNAEAAVLNAKLAKANVAVSDFKKLQEALEKYRAMNPERLQKKNKELRATNDEKTKVITTLKTNNRDLKKKVDEKNLKVGSLANLISEMNVEVEELRKRVLRHDGDVSGKVFNGKNNLQAYIYDFCWGLTTRPNDKSVKTISDLDWHLEVRTNYGLAVIVSITDWIVPFYPICSDLSENWPVDIHDELASIALERCQSSHPHLVDRYDWAKGISIEEIPGLTQRHIKTLTDNNFHSLYSVCHIPPERLTNLVKGMGKETCHKVQHHCMEHVKEWQAANWTREQRGLK